MADVAAKSASVETAAQAVPARAARVPPIRARLPGNQALLRARVQRKVAVGPVDDPLEREADAVAESVMGPPAESPGGTDAARGAEETEPVVQRACAECEEEDEEAEVQRKALDAEPAELNLPASTLAQGGSPLPEPVRRFFEARLGRDFSHVRLHTGRVSEQFNARLRARAFTFGNHIWLGRGQQVGETNLLAHELTHVVQQTAPPPRSATPADAAALPTAEQSKGRSGTASAGGVANPNAAPGAIALPSAPAPPGGEGGPALSSPGPAEAPPAGEEPAAPTPRPHPLPHDLPRRVGTSGSRVQRQPVGGASEVIRYNYGNGFLLVQTPALGRATLRYNGRPYLNFTWQHQAGRQLAQTNVAFEFRREQALPRLTIRVSAPFRVELQVIQSVEQTMADFNTQYLDGRPLEVALDAAQPGSVTVIPPTSTIARTMPTPTVLLNRYAGNAARLPTVVEGERHGEMAAYAGDEQATPSAPLTTTRQVWIQNDQQAFEEFARNHPDTNWAGLTLPDGRVVAYALTEETLRRLAAHIRERDFDVDILGDFPGSRLTSVVLAGQLLGALTDLENLYYHDAYSASVGIEGDYQDCEVFEMAGHSFGRKPLTHPQALDRLRQFDGMTAAQINRVETQPGRPFEALHVRGVSGTVHQFDYEWFQQRDRLLALPEVDPPYDLASNDPGLRVLDAEADRESPDPRLRQFLVRNRPAAATLQQRVVRRIEHTGQQLVIDSINHTLPQFQAVADSDADAALLVLNLSTVSQQRRREILSSLGVGEFFTPMGRLLVSNPILTSPRSLGVAMGAGDVEARERSRIEAIVANRANATRIIMGETVDGVNLGYFRNRARATKAEMETLISRLRAADGSPNTADKVLYAGGPVGAQSRELVYRQWGFTRLRAENYPHRGDTGRWLPGPMDAGTGAYGSIAEQLYANYAARNATIEDLHIAAEIAAAVVIILFSEGAGLVFAELWFGGSTLAQLVISGLVFTALDFALQAALSGQPPPESSETGSTAARLGGQALLNIAMFALFRELNATFGAMGRSGASTLFRISEEAVARSLAARATAGAIRLSALGATFLTLSFQQFIIANGRPPDSREAGRLAAQALLSLVVLEVSSFAARPVFQELRIWGRATRLGVHGPEIESLRTSLRSLNARIAATEFDPRRMGPVAEALAQEYELLLARQRELVTQLQSSLRTRGDAAEVDREATSELQAIDSALETIRQGRFLHRTGIRPVGEPASIAEATEFYYNDTPQTRAEIIQRYGDDNVRPEAGGVLRVTVPGRGTLTFRPAPVEAPAAPQVTPPALEVRPPGEPAAQQPAQEPPPTQVQEPAPGQAQQQPPTQAQQPGQTQPPPAEPTPQAAQPTPTPTPAVTPQATAPNTGPPATSPDFFARRETLAVRREALVQRGRALGIMQAVPEFGPGSARARPMTVQEAAVRLAAQNAIQGVTGLHTRAIRRPAALAAQEQAVQQAEAAAAPEMRRLAQLAFERHSARLRAAGTSLANVRTGDLATMTDREVGEALAEVPAAQGLSEAQLRGVLYAARPPAGGQRIRIREVFDMARSAAERNAVLENFARLMAAGVPGTYEVLRTMTSSRNNWRGGVHVLDYAVNGTGGTGVARFEYGMVDPLTGGQRIYDIVLADGTRIQGKDWSNWFPDSLRSQFRRDVLIMTSQFANLPGIRRLRWVFRAPGPVSEGIIRETMRQALEDVMREFDLMGEVRDALRREFEAHTNLIEIWNGTIPATPTTPPPVTPTPPTLPPPTTPPTPPTPQSPTTP